MAEQSPPRIIKVADWNSFLRWQRRNNFFYSFWFVTFFIIFAMHWFAAFFQRKRLKGNQVQVLNSPAAVSSIQVTSNSLIATGDQSGKAFVTGISQKTYHANKFHCFRGKSVESNEPDKSSIISFITLIQRKCVKTDKLCQVYLCVSGRRDFARTLLNNNRLKKE